LRFAALLFGEQLLAVWRADLITPLSRFPIAKGCSHVNAALPFIHDDCAATGAAAMLTSHYLSGREAVATGRGTVMAVKAGVIRAGARTTRRGAAETFTGVVFQDPVITAEAPSRLGGSVVTFTPGARTAWHSHPVGQTLFCLSGVGRICFKGEKPQVLNPGDTVNIPPDTMHWHGASPDRLFSHLALSEAGEQGQGTAWGTHVSDAEYNEVASGG
jgi:quercetin dioxygenase-like cupin family protein